jgi:hypothetical protein
MTDEKEFDWQIDNLRESIGEDWKNLASKNLLPEKRKAIREHLDICVRSLSGLVQRNRLASQNSGLERYRRVRRAIADAILPKSKRQS